ncbi:hypothetical protein EJB05_08947, partial [Eragrostis curvula]
MYTDSLPDIEDIELDEIHEDEDVVKHLLVAADKYALERLKLVCTDMLCRSLNLRTVVTTLALAELHSCSQLKDACVEYIMTSGKIGHVVASPGLLVVAMAAAAATQLSPPATKTVSRCTAKTTRGTHVFEIDGYSLHKGIGKGKLIRSAAFNVGGYSWCIQYYPDGSPRAESTDHISVFLHLLSPKATVRANFDLRLVDRTTGSSTSVLRDTGQFSTVLDHDGESSQNWGKRNFMKKSDLEASVYLRNDCMVIRCDITIIKTPQVAETAVVEVRVPPSDLRDDFGKLLQTGEGADVTFQVQREVFAAHRTVLAARSPVFRAQLYGQLGQDNREFITIEDMQPGVFNALLHLIYTDSLPDIKDIELDEIHEDEDVVKHLLVAADKYALERLKLVCTDMLCKSLNVRTVANTLALAELHSCSLLKDACIEYIMTSGRIGDVVASPGYQHLKKDCPIVFISLWEKAITLALCFKKIIIHKCLKHKKTS